MADSPVRKIKGRIIIFKILRFSMQIFCLHSNAFTCHAASIGVPPASCTYRQSKQGYLSVGFIGHLGHVVIPGKDYSKDCAEINSISSTGL